MHLSTHLTRLRRTLRGQPALPSGYENAYDTCVRRGDFAHLDLFVDPQRAAIDVGANAGLYSLYLARHACRVLAVEPLAHYAHLAHVLPANVVFRNVAAGATHGQATLHTPLSEGRPVYGLSTLQAAEGQAQTVAVWPLDDLVPDALPDTPVGFVKIDVEGYEVEVLRGSQTLLAEQRPNLMVEVEPKQLAAVCAALPGYRGLFFYRGRLYDLSRLDAGVHRQERYAWTPGRNAEFREAEYVVNFYFVPAD